MTYDEALNWLLEVDGRLYHANRHQELESWIAVVRVPGPVGRAGKLIVSRGASAEAATAAAEQRWQALWDDLSKMH